MKEREKMNPEQVAETWKLIVCVFLKTRETAPANTIREILKTGADPADLYETFAVVTQIKKHDGRIYGENRKAMEAITVDPECLVWERPNPVMKAGLDDIHPTHINQLITALRKEVPR